MAKNIVIFSDGTGQEGGSDRNTNVYKLFSMIEDRTSRQVAFYDRGLGTGWRKVSGNVGGKGISANIKECYEFIFDQFEAGDQVYLFGFSRGAATVRSLSSFIHYFGILPKSRPELIEEAYDIYKISREKKRKKKAGDFVRKNRTIWARIQFVGCYDTVAALGLPFKAASVLLDGIPGFRHRFHNFRLSESIENAYHALAIDDERTSFHPVLWEPEVEAHQKVRQVWFAGMHTDVGGGYEEQSLSDIPLVWLTEMAVRHGLHIYPDHSVEIIEDADGVMHDSRGEGVKKLFRRKARFWDTRRPDRPVVHQSVFDRKRNQKNEADPPYRPWILDHEPDVEPWVPLPQLKWGRREGG
ncbi:MAG: DUF2235 domain-containing protein [Deltaproteobacteria bacterium]|nr:DUF2235 domain-containing protein [Deltaproteobacteria bacterium]